MKKWLVLLLCILLTGCNLNSPALNQNSPTTPAIQDNENFHSYSKSALLEAANAGNPNAQYELGFRYRKGSNGMPRDYRQAAFWFSKAANQGHAAAQYSLGVRYLLGQGIPQSDANAIEWLNKSAAQDNPYAENELAHLYAEGRGVPQDYEQAAHWFQEAANHGLASAQYNLGLMYENGIGLPKDHTQAVFWLRKAGSHGFPLTRNTLNSVPPHPTTKASTGTAIKAKVHPLPKPNETPSS